MEWKRADQDASGSIQWDEFLNLGKRRKVLATLTERLAVPQNPKERAAMLIQKRHLSNKSLRPHDGQIRATQVTSRV